MQEDALHAPRSVADPEDLAAGRALLHAIEFLGEVLGGLIELPAPLRPHAERLAAGRSRVPADGERTDFITRLIDRRDGRVGASPLHAWLGSALDRWLVAAREARPLSALGLALGAPIDAAVEARQQLRARHQPAADAFVAWFAADADALERATFGAASSVALDEAVDRWASLGCESDLARYVASWQRSASGWADAALGRAFVLDTASLGDLRAVQLHLLELQQKGAPRRELPRLVARRMGISAASARRLIEVHRDVADRATGRAAIERRMALIRPIARAADELSRELRREPRVDEIARRAEVHPCLVELALDAVERAT